MCTSSIHFLAPFSTFFTFNLSVCPKVVNISSTFTSHSSISLTWTMPRELTRIYSYQLQYCPTFNCSDPNMTVWRSSTTATLDNLLPGVTYNITVHAVGVCYNRTTSNCTVRASDAVTMGTLPSLPLAAPTIASVVLAADGMHKKYHK